MNHYRDSGIKTVADALIELRTMHAQIIHGSSIFGDIANLLEKESNRLDWMDKYCDWAEQSQSGADDIWWRMSHHDGNKTEDVTIRETIDSAMRDYPL